MGKTAKERRSEARRALADKLANLIREHGLTTIYGGDVELSHAPAIESGGSKGRPYRIGFSRQRTLDGEISVYGLNFIQFIFASPGCGEQNIVVGNECDAIAMMNAIAMHDWDAITHIPRKQRRGKID